jgi:hypothetical protein
MGMSMRFVYLSLLYLLLLHPFLFASLGVYVMYLLLSSYYCYCFLGVVYVCPHAYKGGGVDLDECTWPVPPFGIFTRGRKEEDSLTADSPVQRLAWIRAIYIPASYSSGEKYPDLCTYMHVNFTQMTDLTMTH